MVQVCNYSELLRLIASVRDLRQGFLTNFYPDEIKHNIWIRYGVLYYEWIDSVLFLFKENSNFRNLFYCAPSQYQLANALQEIKNDKCTITDLVGKKEQCQQLELFFLHAGFINYSKLVRMSRMTSQSNFSMPDRLSRVAEIKETDEIVDLLQKYFDPRAEQIPFLEEICSLIKQGNVIVRTDREKIIGFLIYELTKSTLYLRYWFVHPDYRDQKVGSSLMSRFFYEGRETRRQLFWVICNNENAIKRYRHYGFETENLYDQILKIE
ncbi:MAG: GNAT family N-acetyltransferase [Odoribacter splanchnicus]